MSRKQHLQQIRSLPRNSRMEMQKNIDEQVKKIENADIFEDPEHDTG